MQICCRAGFFEMAVQAFFNKLLGKGRKTKQANEGTIDRAGRRTYSGPQFIRVSRLGSGKGSTASPWARFSSGETRVPRRLKELRFAPDYCAGFRVGLHSADPTGDHRSGTYLPGGPPGHLLRISRYA